jgi:hypothetical protein
MARILIIDDEPLVGNAVAESLRFGLNAEVDIGTDRAGRCDHDRQGCLRTCSH